MLDAELQAGKRRTRHRWEDRARVAINLGPSPQHGKSVHLLLNTQTGLVSPQFHATFDDQFDTTRHGTEISLPKSLWQQKTYFTEPSKSRPAKTVHQPNGTVDVTQAYHFAPTTSETTATNASPIEVPTEEPNTEPLPELSQVQTPTTTRSGRSSRPPE